MPRPIEEIMAELQDAIARNLEAVDTIKEPGRVISRSARNVQPGMLVEFPHIGWRDCTGVTNFTEQNRTLLTDGRGAFWPVPSRHRVRTRIT